MKVWSSGFDLKIVLLSWAAGSIPVGTYQLLTSLAAEHCEIIGDRMQHQSKKIQNTFHLNAKIAIAFHCAK